MKCASSLHSRKGSFSHNSIEVSPGKRLREAVGQWLEHLECRTLLSAYIGTDQSDYQFGGTAFINGGGFRPREAVVLRVRHAKGTPGSNADPQNKPWRQTADAHGHLAAQWLVNDPDARGSTYVLTARGLSSGETARTMFTDGAATAATGGSAISADTNATNGTGAWTALTGPSYAESATGQVGVGTIILNAPTGFVFDTGGTAPTILITGGTTSARNINAAATGTSASMTTITSTQLTFTVTSSSSSGSGSANNTLTWQNVRVRPTAATPLATGNITKTGTSSMNGVTNNTTNFGTLTEVAGAATHLAVNQQPTTVVAGATITPSVTVRILDQFNNLTSNTSSVTIAIGTNPNSGVLGGTLTRAAVAGTATFNNLTISRSGEGYTLDAASSGLTGVTSLAFNVLTVAPTVTSPSVAATTNTTTVIVAGSALANSLVEVWADATRTVLAGSQQLTGGATGYSISAALASNSVNNLVVTATETGGVQSNATTVPAITQDSVAPTVNNVTSTTSNNTYGEGVSSPTTIAITIAFSENVTVTGTPQLALNSGGTANYSSGNGTSTLTFNYVVDPSHASADLDYLSTGSLTLNGGTISDLVGNAANLTLPAPGATGSLGANKNLVIATTSAPINLGNTTNTSGSSITLTGAAIDAAVGDTVVVVLAIRNPGTPTLSISDSSSNAYSSLADAANPGDSRTVAYYAPVTTALVNGTITITTTGYTSTKILNAYRISGLAASPVDQTNTGSADTGGVSVATATTTQADEIVLGGVSLSTANGVAVLSGGGFTQIDARTMTNSGSDVSLLSEYKLVTATGIQTVTATPSTSGDNWAAVAGTLKYSLPAVSSINRATSSPTSDSTVSWNVTFSRPVTGVGITDFSLVSTGLGGAPAITSVTQTTSTTYTVTAGTGTGSGTLGLNLVDDDSIRSSQGIKLGGTGTTNGDFTGEEYTLDRTAPTLSSINRSSPAGSPTNSDTLTWLVTFDEAVSGVSAGNFTGAGTTATIGTPTTGDGGLTWSITLSGGDLPSLNGMVGLDLTSNSSVNDLAGNALSTTSLTGQTYVVDNTAPESTIAFPANAGQYSPADWNAGGGTPAGDITGSSNDSGGAGLEMIEVSIRQGLGNYWDGSSFASAGEVFFPAAGTGAWSLAFPASNFASGGEYTVHARGSDDAGNVESSPMATFTITGQNNDPDTNDVSASADEDGPSVDISADYTDIDTNDSHTFTIDTTGTLGSVTNNNDGTFTYDPNGAFETLADGETTTDTFTYTVDDGNGGTDTATVTVTITGQNDDPTANDVDADAFEDGPSVNIYADFTDADDTDAHTFSIDTTGTLGTVTNNNDGTFTYDPAGAFESLAFGESTTDTFNYTVDDGNGGTDTATVTVTITGQNDTPTANDVDADAFEDGPSVDISADYTDIDTNDSHTFTINTTGTLGTVTNNNDGTFTYDPNGAFETLSAGETATDNFTYTVDDGNGGTDIATVTVTITGQNDAPTANDVTAAANEDGPSIGISADYTDIDTNDSHTVTVDDTGTLGTVTNNNDGTFTYDPAGAFESLADGESTTDTFTYTVDDGNGGTDSATITVTITGQNDTPTANDVTAAANEDGPSIGISADYTDIDTNDSHTVAIDDTGTLGTVTNNNDGTFTYDPAGAFESLADGETTTDTFTYTVDDGNGGTDSATITVTITGQNDAPTANDVDADALEDGPSVNISADFTDADDTDAHTFSIDTTGTLGTVTNNNDGTFTYDPNGAFETLSAGETTSDTFTYTVDDGNGGTDTATVTVTITGQNDDPTANDVDADALEDGPSIDISADYTDVDASDTHAYTVDDTGTVGTVTNNNDGTFTYNPNGAFESLAFGESTTDTFTYTLDDGNGGTDTATVTVTITGQNDDPDAHDIAASAEEDGPSVNISADFTDADDTDAHTFSIDTTGTVGTVTNNNDGTFTYDPAGAFESLAFGESTTDTFTYIVNDGNGGTDTATVTVTITGQNDTPTANDVAASANEDGPSIDIAADFTDVDTNDSHTFTINTTGTLGTVTNNNDGTFTYDPNGALETLSAGESTTDTFTYTVDDGNGGTDTATVTVTITGQNDVPTANDVTAAANEDGPSIGISADYTDIDTNDSHTFTIDTTGTLGSVTNNNDGTFTYDPAGAFETLAFGESTTDTFTYTVDDGNGGTDTATVTITITGQNDTPTANDVDADALEDGPSIDISADYTDIDTNDSHTFTINTTGTLGTVTNNNDGTFTYNTNGAFETLSAGETAADSFHYTVDDGNGGTDTAIVTVTITGQNDAPTANDVTAAANEDGPAVDISADYTDIDTNDSHTFTIDTTGTLGSVTNNNDGTFTYDPNGAFETLADGETTTDTFTYTVDDGNGGTDTATVTVTITGQNDDPTANDVDADAFEDGPSVNIYADFTDAVDTDAHTFSIDTTGTLGTVTNNNDGTFTYDPAGAFESLAFGESTTDTFNYTVDDGNGGTDTATVTVTITGQNDTPTANDVDADAFEDGPSVDISADYTDIDTNDSHTFTINTTGTLGTVTNNNDGTFTYNTNGAFETLSAGETAADSFHYTVDDGNGGTDTAIVTVTITGQNDAPTANDVNADAFEDGPSIDIIADYTDIDTNDSHTLTIDTAGTVGTVTNNNDGTFTYDPAGAFESLADGETTSDTFTYTVDDGNGGTDTATVTVTITGQNDVPTANDVTAAANEDGPSVDISADYTDIDTNDSHTVTIDTPGTLGTVTNNNDGTFTYNTNGAFETLSAGETATDNFTYTVDDGNGGTDIATVTVTITGQNDDPTANDVTAAANEDGPSVDISADYTDIDTNDSHTFTINTTGTVGTVTNNNDGTFTYDPAGAFESLADGETTSDIFTYTVDDGNGGTDTATVTVTITGQNDDPTANDVDADAFEDGPSIGISADYTDIDTNDIHTFTIDTTGTLGTVTNNNDGTFTYDPNGAFETFADGETTTDTFTYTVDDGNGGTDTATVTVTITGQNDAPTANDVDADALEDGPSIDIAADYIDIDTNDSHTLTIDTTGTLGTVTNNNDGTFTYDPAGAFETLAFGESTTDTFTYTVDDGNGGTDTATVTVTITGQNDSPTANDVDADALEDGPSIDIAADYIDIDTNDSHTLTIDTTGTVGTVTNNNDGTFTYNPNGAFESLAFGESTADTFTYTVDDSNGGTDTATVTVTITGQNDTPTANDVDADAFEDGPSIGISADYTDIDTNDSHTFTINTTGTLGTVTNNNDGTFTYDLNGAFETLSAGETATDSFTYSVDDGNGGTDTAIITITINGQDDGDPTRPTLTGTPGEDLFYIQLDGTGTILQVFNINPPAGAPIYSASYSTLNSLTLDAGEGDDQVIVDWVNGNPIPPEGISYLGGPPTASDTLKIIGDGATVGSYNPSGVSTGMGSVEVDGGLISLDSVESITVSDMISFTVITGGDDDAIDFDSPNAGRSRLTGNSAGVSIAPLTFFNISTFILDTATNDASAGDDFITIDAVGLPAAGLNLFKVAAGTGSNTLDIHGGGINLDATGGDNLAVSADNSAIVRMSSSQRLASLTLRNTAQAHLIQGAAMVLRTAGLSVTDSAILDIHDNDMIVEATPTTALAVLSDLTALIGIGRNTNAPVLWTGNGITSSSAAANTSKLTGIAIMLNGQDGSTLRSMFDDEPITDSSILIKYSWNGDSDLTGEVDSDDYFNIDSGYAAGGLSGYYHGDLDYNNDIDADDYFHIDSAYSGQSGVLAMAASPLPRAVVAVSNASPFAFGAPIQLSPPRKSLKDTLSPIAQHILEVLLKR